MSDPLVLARRLRALGPEGLAAVLTEREVTRSGLHDLFDLADALLEPDSIRAALRPLPREDIEQLAAGRLPEGEGAAVALGVSEPEPHVFDAVRDVAASVLAAAPAPHTTPAVATTTTSAADARGGERAFAAISAVSELGHRLRSAPLRLLARGGLSAADERRLSPALALEPHELAPLVDIAEAAGLVSRIDDRLWSTREADAWNLLPAAERWLALATAWLGTLDAPTTRTLAGFASDGTWPTADALGAAFRSRHPAADDAMIARLDAVTSSAELLGLLADTDTDSAPTAFGAAALQALASTPSQPTSPRFNPHTAAHASTAATPSAPQPTDPPSATQLTDPPPAPQPAAPRASLESLAALLPAEVTQVYVQHDLTVISPGPLAPELDARLRRAADLENRGLASGYRVTQQSIDRALAEGETPESLRTFLAGLSLTGVPQALDYLIAEGGRRHGMIRVRAENGTDPGSPRSHARARVITAEPALADALAIDNDLLPLGFERVAPTVLVSRIEPSTVYWSLLDARYPALAQSATGEPLSFTRERVAPSRPAATVAAATGPTFSRTALDLAHRLIASTAATDDDSAWMARRLDQAVRARASASIDVQLPDGTSRHLDVTPLSVANGRLRCLDLRAGVERTIPLSSITALTTTD
ncbi:helicase-associated domain-containing protein [Herbiconiux moechotypicola]|uniref:Helicase XPB/Ssl2 N-terminal domain-containing protein n=1 Tax=Herbiconiux moechotypicola TaxID=637393 RepID=A0ABN3DRG4_9MICO|nr:helicase-associated domain-containing protein [Herbiconiux moechotypicola]MCS5730708.1 helicase-associated domain-containing protein [Herbiconiux moechotypicola]